MISIKKLILKRIIKLNEVIRECYYFILFILSLQFMKHVLDFCVIIWTQTSACHRTTNKPYTNGCDNSLWLTSLGMTTFRRSLSYPLNDKIINSWWAYSYFLNQWIILMCRQLFFFTRGQEIICYSNMMSFFRFENKRAIY